MRFVQYYLECLSQASYLVGDEITGRAAVVDPRRDVDEYLDDAAAVGLRIEYVIETHVHADFLSGHLELAAATGATIVYRAAADVHVPHQKAADGERICLGKVVLEVRATPGHTPESISVVVWERADAVAPYAVLTGDTLFIGDVGRPDLTTTQGRSAEDMARLLHRSIHTRLMTLPDTTRVYPAHGAGSVCGKNLSTETCSTIGDQRRTNYALQLRSVEGFIEAVTEGQPPQPGYFAHVAELNRQPHQLLRASEPASLSLEEVLDRQARGTVILDVRPPEVFARGHLRGSINLGLEGRFAEYAGEVIKRDDEIIIVGEPAHAHQARIRLSRVGLDTVSGALNQPTLALALRPEVVQAASRVTARQLADALTGNPDLVILDIRSPTERAQGHIHTSVHIPLPQLPNRACELDPTHPLIVYCAGGYRSSIAASLLRIQGFPDVSDLLGGYHAWVAASTAREEGPPRPG